MTSAHTGLHAEPSSMRRWAVRAGSPSRQRTVASQPAVPTAAAKSSTARTRISGRHTMRHEQAATGRFVLPDRCENAHVLRRGDTAVEADEELPCSSGGRAAGWRWPCSRSEQGRT